jgi:hypothetical protein
MLNLDVITPNFQLVECYIVFTEMELAKKNEDPDAAVCTDLSNHEIFEKWRVVKTSALVRCQQPGQLHTHALVHTRARNCRYKPAV